MQNLKAEEGKFVSTDLTTSVEDKVFNEEINCDKNKNCTVFGSLAVGIHNVDCRRDLNFIYKVTQLLKSFLSHLNHFQSILHL